MASPLLELRNLNLQFGDLAVLKSVSLRVEKGERVALIGPSGHGKSSLLKILAGLLPPTSGEFWFEGQDFHTLPEAEQIKLRFRMGMLFQKNALFDSMKNLENVCFPLREAGVMDEAQLISKATFFLEAVGLGAAMGLFPDEISGGMQKRLGIARALALNPEVVFYDDPTAGLDPITSRKIVDLINDLQKSNNSTVVAVTNDMNRVRQIADRVLLVLNSELLEIGSPDEMRQHPDARVRQFVLGQTAGPLMGLQ